MASKRILIVEDKPFVNHAMKEILEADGFECEFADKLLPSGRFGLGLPGMMPPNTTGEKRLKAWEKIGAITTEAE